MFYHKVNKHSRQATTDFLTRHYTAQEYTEVQEITCRIMQPIGYDLLTITF